MVGEVLSHEGNVGEGRLRGNLSNRAEDTQAQMNQEPHSLSLSLSLSRLSVTVSACHLKLVELFASYLYVCSSSGKKIARTQSSNDLSRRV